jgi:hypothetical protein
MMPMSRGDEEIIDDALDMLAWQRRERERLTAESAAMRAAGDKLAGFAEHDSDCQWPAGPDHCSCGYSVAVQAWQEARGDD